VAIVMKMHWQGVSLEQYDEARQLVGWEIETPRGAIHHIAWADPDGLNVIDLWDSAEDFEAFAHDRLMPVVKGQLGIEGEPVVEMHPLHARFVPVPVGV
jgi:hypothetical protein